MAMKTAGKLVQILCASGLLAACGGGGGSADPIVGADVPTPVAWDTSPVARYGRLKVCDTPHTNRICAEDGTTQVQLRGMSLFWSNDGWGGEKFYNANVVGNLADQWTATVVRAAIGAQGGGDYTTSPTSNMTKAKAVIDAAIARGVYVIVDWHSHGHDATDLSTMTTQTKNFFLELAAAYPDAKNLIWEPFNEPPGYTYTWAAVKAHHVAVIAALRDAGNENLVVAGSPMYSQDVDVAAASPIADANTAYTLHFYAGTHGATLRTKAETAMNTYHKAIFVTEWGTCSASGNGGFNRFSSNEWIDWMDANGISSANWAMNDKNETASALVLGASTSGPWGKSALTESGRLALGYVHEGYTQPVEVALEGTKAGTVTGPGGIECGSVCTARLPFGNAVTLTATADAGSTFAGWSGDCTGTAACVLEASAARSVTATFTTP